MGLDEILCTRSPDDEDKSFSEKIFQLYQNLVIICTAVASLLGARKELENFHLRSV